LGVKREKWGDLDEFMIDVMKIKERSLNDSSFLLSDQ